MTEEWAENEDIPQKWIDLNLPELVKAGWRPRIKRKGQKEYLTLRLGDQERSLGRATEELIALFGDLFPRLKSPLMNPTARPMKKTKLLSVPLKRIDEIGTSYRPSLEVLHWYSWAKGKGFNSSLGDFVNEVVHTYFVDEKNWRLAVVKRMG